MQFWLDYLFGYWPLAIFSVPTYLYVQRYGSADAGFFDGALLIMVCLVEGVGLAAYAGYFGPFANFERGFGVSLIAVGATDASICLITALCDVIATSEAEDAAEARKASAHNV